MSASRATLEEEVSGDCAGVDDDVVVVVVAVVPSPPLSLDQRHVLRRRPRSATAAAQAPSSSAASSAPVDRSTYQVSRWRPSDEPGGPRPSETPGPG